MYRLFRLVKNVDWPAVCAKVAIGVAVLAISAGLMLLNIWWYGASMPTLAAWLGLR